MKYLAPLLIVAVLLCQNAIAYERYIASASILAPPMSQRSEAESPSGLENDGCKRIQKLIRMIEDSSVDDAERLYMLSQLCDVYEATGNYAAAESVLLQEIDILKQQTPAGERLNEAVTGTVYAHLASMACYLNNYSHAEQYCRRAIPILASEFGRRSPEVGAVLNNLAWVKARQGCLDAAETHLQESLQIISSTIGDDTTVYALICTNMAELKALKGSKKLSGIYFDRAIHIFESTYGRNDEDVVLLKNRAAKLLGSKRAQIVH
jgi:tetratricopeptide (TPR) repeat protein